MPKFWGLNVKGGSNALETIPEGYYLNVTQAALSGGKNASTRLFAVVDEKDFLVCTLSDSQPNCQLSLTFGDDDETVQFRTEGSGEVSLIGVLAEDMGPDVGGEGMYPWDSEDDEGMDDEDEDEEEEEEEEQPKGKPQAAAKRSLPGPSNEQNKKAKVGGEGKQQPQQQQPKKEQGAKKEQQPVKKEQGGKPQPAAGAKGAALTCNKCSKTFTSENALTAHNKAKHS